jgi:hypothetical protein
LAGKASSSSSSCHCSVYISGVRSAFLLVRNERVVLTLGKGGNNAQSRAVAVVKVYQLVDRLQGL